MYVRQTIFVFMLFVYLGLFLVFSHFLIIYACSIIAVYRYGATLVNLIYLGFVLLLIVPLFICLNLRLNLQFISTLLFCLATAAVLNFDMNTTFDG